MTSYERRNSTQRYLLVYIYILRICNLNNLKIHYIIDIIGKFVAASSRSIEEPKEECLLIFNIRMYLKVDVTSVSVSVARNSRKKSLIDISFYSKVVTFAPMRLSQSIWLGLLWNDTLHCLNLDLYLSENQFHLT